MHTAEQWRYFNYDNAHGTRDAPFWSTLLKLKGKKVDIMLWSQNVSSPRRSYHVFCIFQIILPQLSSFSDGFFLQSGAPHTDSDHTQRSRKYRAQSRGPPREAGFENVTISSILVQETAQNCISKGEKSFCHWDCEQRAHKERDASPRRSPRTPFMCVRVLQELWFAPDCTRTRDEFMLEQIPGWGRGGAIIGGSKFTGGVVFFVETGNKLDFWSETFERYSYNTASQRRQTVRPKYLTTQLVQHSSSVLER